jgi:hypothetical protein
MTKKDELVDSDEGIVGKKESVKKITNKTSKKKVDEKKEMKLEDLPGVGPAAVEKLEAAGIFDLMGVAVLGPKELGDLAGLGEAAARKTIQAARKMMDLGFQSGLEFAEKRKEVFNITTGSNLIVFLVEEELKPRLLQKLLEVMVVVRLN